MFNAILNMLFLADATAPTSISEMWVQWGLAGVVVAYTLTRDWQREKRMTEAIERHQQWVQSTLLAALDRSSIAIEKITRLEREREGDHVLRPTVRS